MPPFLVPSRSLPGRDHAAPVPGFSVTSITFVFPANPGSFFKDLRGERVPSLVPPRKVPATRYFMSFHYFAGAACRALTARKDGPSLYDVCDPVLSGQADGDPHLAKFYKTALGNPALRVLLRRAGLSELRDEARLSRLREGLDRARG